MMNAYILGGLRSYVGVVNGMYRHIPAEKLGAAVLRQVMDRYKITEPDYIIAGNGVGAGGNIARLMALEAGVDCSVPAFTVDVQCGSGLESIAVAAAKLHSGEADCIIAGGFESSSTQPRRGYNPNHPDYAGDGGACKRCAAGNHGAGVWRGAGRGHSSAYEPAPARQDAEGAGGRRAYYGGQFLPDK